MSAFDILAASPIGNCGDLGVPCSEASQSNLQSILSIVFIVIGALCVVMVVIGGFKYVVSSGNPENTKAAKNTIIYALVGLALAFFATAIVNFVVGHV